MKLYLASETYVGTRAEARALDREFRQIEVPTDKPGLIDHLNRIVDFFKDQLDAAGIERCPKCGDRPVIAADIVESQDAGAIAAWILDEASPAQIEQLFGALGARFHELRKECDNGQG